MLWLASVSFAKMCIYECFLFCVISSVKTRKRIQWKRVSGREDRMKLTVQDVCLFDRIVNQLPIFLQWCYTLCMLLLVLHKPPVLLIACGRIIVIFISDDAFSVTPVCFPDGLLSDRFKGPIVLWCSASISTSLLFFKQFPCFSKHAFDV